MGLYHSLEHILRPLTTVAVDAKPNGSILPQAGRALGLAVKGGCRLDAAKQDAAMQRFGVSVPWTDTFIEELKIGLVACRAL